MKKLLCILPLVAAASLFGAPATDTNILAGFKFSVRSNYNLLFPVAYTNGDPIRWTNLLLGATISNSTFYGDGRGLTNLFDTTNRLIIVGANFTNTTTNGALVYTITNVAGGGGDTLWGTNVAAGGITNTTGAGYLAVWLKTSPLWFGESPTKAAISSSDGSAVFGNSLLEINALGSIRRNTNFSFEGSSGAFALGVSPLYSTNFGQVIVQLTNKTFEIDSTNVVRFIDNKVRIFNQSGGSITDSNLGPSVAVLGTDTGSRIVASTAFSRQVTIYTNTTPTAEGVLPGNTNLPAISYKLDGTDLMYVWNTNTFVWQ